MIYKKSSPMEQKVSRLNKPYKIKLSKQTIEIRRQMQTLCLCTKNIENDSDPLKIKYIEIKNYRVGLPKLENKYMNRGDFQVQTSALGISAYKWQDNRPVHFVPNFHGSHSKVVKRTNKQSYKGEKLKVCCPEVVKDYNLHMGGVDLADQLRQYYCVNRRSHKWWHRYCLSWETIDIASVISCVIYISINTKMSFLEYRRAVAQGLMAKKQKPNAPKRRPSDPQCRPNQLNRGKHDGSISNDLRLGNRGVHFVLFTDKRGCCEVCSKSNIESRPFSIFNMCKAHLYIRK